MLLNSTGVIILLSQRYFSIGETEASILDPFKDLSIAFISFLAGIFITKIGYRKAMIYAFVLLAITCFIVPSIKTFWSIKLIYAVSGFGFGISKVAVFGILGLISQNQKEHLSLMNFIESIFMLGIVSGYFLFSYMSSDSNPDSWLNVFYIMGVIIISAFALLLSTPIDESKLKVSDNNQNYDYTAMFKLLFTVSVGVFILCAFINVLIEQSTMNWLPTFYKKVILISEKFSILLSTILSLSMALGRLLSGYALKKISWINLLSISLLSAGLILLVSVYLVKNNQFNTEITDIKDIPFVAFLLPLIGVFLAPIYPTINSVILASIPVQKHAAMTGLIVIFSAIGGSIGSVFTGFMFEKNGGLTAFSLGIIPIIILLVMIRIFYSIISKSQN